MWLGIQREIGGGLCGWTAALCTFPSYEQFDLAFRLEASWALTFSRFFEVESHHNSVAFHISETSSFAFLRQCVHVYFFCQESSLAQWDDWQKVIQSGCKQVHRWLAAQRLA
jgi:hypothetical protein